MAQVPAQVKFRVTLRKYRLCPRRNNGEQRVLQRLTAGKNESKTRPASHVEDLKVF